MAPDVLRARRISRCWQHPCSPSCPWFESDRRDRPAPPAKPLRRIQTAPTLRRRYPCHLRIEAFSADSVTEDHDGLTRPPYLCYSDDTLFSDPECLHDSDTKVVQALGGNIFPQGTRGTSIAGGIQFVDQLKGVDADGLAGKAVAFPVVSIIAFNTVDLSPCARNRLHRNTAVRRIYLDSAPLHAPKVTERWRRIKTSVIGRECCAASSCGRLVRGSTGGPGRIGCRDSRAEDGRTPRSVGHEVKEDFSCGDRTSFIEPVR